MLPLLRTMHPEVMTSGLDMQEGGHDLRDIGIEPGIAGLLLSPVMNGWGLLVDGPGDAGGGIGGTERFRIDGGPGTVIDIDIVVRVPAVAGGGDDIDAVGLEAGCPLTKAGWVLVQGPGNTMSDGGYMVILQADGLLKFFIEVGTGGPVGELRGHYGRADLIAVIIEGDIIDTAMACCFAAGTAGFCGHVVGTEDGIVLLQIGKMVVAVDGGKDTLHAPGDRQISAGRDFLHLVGRGHGGTLFAR